MQTKFLKELLATLYSLQLKTQGFHWNIEGEQFDSLHRFFEKQYQELAQTVDDVAERIRFLGEKVEASFTSFKQSSKLSSKTSAQSGKEMLSELQKDYQELCSFYREMIPSYEKDLGTSELLTGQLLGFEKTFWMVRSFLR